jgi:hypothetical protein
MRYTTHWQIVDPVTGRKFAADAGAAIVMEARTGT